MKNKFKCAFCTKTFAKEFNKNKHETEFCTSNPNSLRSIENAKDATSFAEAAKAVEIINKTEEVVEAVNDYIDETIVEPKATEKITPEELEVPTEPEDKYTEDQKWLIQFYSTKTLGNCTMTPAEKDKIYTLYLKIIKKPMDRNCTAKMLHAFIVLYHHTKAIL